MMMMILTMMIMMTIMMMMMMMMMTFSSSWLIVSRDVTTHFTSSEGYRMIIGTLATNGFTNGCRW